MPNARLTRRAGLVGRRLPLQRSPRTFASLAAARSRALEIYTWNDRLSPAHRESRRICAGFFVCMGRRLGTPRGTHRPLLPFGPSGVKQVSAIPRRRRYYSVAVLLCQVQLDAMRSEKAYL